MGKPEEKTDRYCIPIRRPAGKEKRIIKVERYGKIPCVSSCEAMEQSLRMGIDGAIKIGQFFVDRGYMCQRVEVLGGTTSYNDGEIGYKAHYFGFESFKAGVESDWHDEYRRVSKEGYWGTLERISIYTFTFINDKEAEEIKVRYYADSLLVMMWVEPCPNIDGAIAEMIQTAMRELYQDDSPIEIETKYVDENDVSWEL